MQSPRAAVHRMAARRPRYSVNLRMACILLVGLLLFELGIGPGAGSGAAEASPQSAPSSSSSSSSSNRNYQRMRHYHQRAHYRHRGHGHQQQQQHPVTDKQPEEPAPNDPAAAGSPINLLDEVTRKQVEKCYRDFVVMERCQRCASVTKSMTVFPLCCADVDGVQVWCQEYLDFGSE